MTPVLKISAVQMLGLAALGVAAGAWVKRRLPVLARLNIPTPIVGGMLYAMAALMLRDRVVTKPDISLQLGLAPNSLGGAARNWLPVLHSDDRDTFRTTLDVVCGNTSPGAPGARVQLCLLVRGPVSRGRRSVSGGWYVPPRTSDVVPNRYGCFGAAGSEAAIRV